MPSPLPVIFDHSCHTLHVDDVKDRLDVLAFEGEEHLSQPFTYRIEFTCPQQDLAAEQFLGRAGHFSLHPPAHTLPRALPGFPVPAVVPLRTLRGTITGLQRLSGSVDEARYEVTLQPRLALLARGRQYRLYQDRSVPQIVEHILRSRHGFLGQDFIFTLSREYPRREQVMQYGESDLAFIDRLLAEVGIWYRFTSDDRLRIDVVQFHDDQRQYQRGVKLAQHPPSGFASHEDSVWALQTRHQVVEKNIHFRSYDPRNLHTWLKGEVDHSRRATTTYGEAYHYAEPYTALGDPLALDEDLLSESGFFYARLRHERYLNDQVRLSGTSSSATLAPGQVLNILGDAPKAFAPGAVLTRLITRAARDSSLIAHFEAIPYSETVCFRPPLPDKPRMAGTVPARVTSNHANDPYSHIDREGRYKVSFLFDRDEWPQGKESMWLRLARPYAGDVHGLHLPLIQGAEVAVAFEQGDPDKPYIAHALHDSGHVDHVTLGKRDYTRNVLRTPANNKLRMEDRRGEEHVKLSTEYSGKSQLNLGHLVDAEKHKRGEGFELRTDGWGAIRAGKGLFISADEQAKAQGPVLEMQAAVKQVEQASQQLGTCQAVAAGHHNLAPASDGLQRLQADAQALNAPAIVLSAPKGIAALTSASLLLHSGDAMYLQSQDELNLCGGQRLSAQSEQGMSLLAREEGMRLVSGKGPLEIESHGDLLNLIAQQDITVQSVQGHLQLTARNGITLGCGGGFIRITPSGEIQIHSTGLLGLKGQHRFEGPGGESFPLPELPSSVCKECLEKAKAASQIFVAEGG
ncbi:type VI secretion system Vgr family protein [Pseudomonas ovata]|uniref:type VI secretion system Vgr family protein n=1 Tax=Pseudomonas ovata TaxID=1839709 RepID=UPI000D690E34|nr:type VI secretion system Vgr family protein [Pseudomonas ovata]